MLKCRYTKRGWERESVNPKYIRVTLKYNIFKINYIKFDPHISECAKYIYLIN